MAPGVCRTRAETPELPRPPMPTGQGTDLPTPGPLFQRASMAARWLVNTNVVPELSARRTTVIHWCGKETPGLSWAIAASSQEVIVPRKMLTYVLRDSLMAGLPGRL